MKFNSASEIESVVWQMKLADYYRGLNRSRINDLFNGVPPYTDTEVEENKIATNVNFLESTKLAHDARRQFYNAFLKPGNYFSIKGDTGPRHKREAWSRIVTKEMNRVMKRSLGYFEMFRSNFASVVLHGIGPSVWNDDERWEPDPIGIEDVLIPGATLLTMKNLPFFAVYRQYTVYQLGRMTSGPKVDPAWQMPVVNEVMKWATDEAGKLMGTTWPEIWSPEKMGERLKEDGGLYAGDTVPTINCWDFYFYDDSGKESGWKRRIVLDSQITPGAGGSKPALSSKNLIGKSNQFLYDSGDRIYSSKRESIIHFQFGDLSAVSPFRYHTVRSLGFLLYAICHLQNRLRCKFNDSIFEGLMQYFRVGGEDEAEKAIKINLIDKGIIDQSVEFVKAQDRWKVDQALVESGIGHNREIMGSNSASYVQDYSFGSDQQKKTATQVMAETNSATALVGAALLQAYAYQTFQYYEIGRRFCKRNSRDVDVGKFRAACLRQGVPEYFLNSDSWEMEPERVMGSGDKMLETTIANQLMQYRNLYDPEPQRAILRDFTLAITDDPGRADSLVPEQPVKVTDSFHDAQLAMGVLMQGMPVGLKTGMNHIEYVDAILESMGAVIQGIEQQGGMATMEQFTGLNNVANHVSQHIALIAQDEGEKQRVKQYGDSLGKMMNMVRAYGQRIQEQQQAAAQEGQGPTVDPKDAAKSKAMVIQAKQKAQANAESHAQKTAQRQVQFEQEQKRKAEQHQADLKQQAEKNQMELEAKANQDALELQQQQKQGILDSKLQVAQNRIDLKSQVQENELALEAAKEQAKAKKAAESKSKDK